jgi:glycine cleavage system aminomethyltransferase T
VGQEVIIRVLHRGHGRVARKLVGLVFPPDGVPPIPGEKLQAGEREIGTVTSAASSPALARPIALGYVHRDFTSPGTRVNVATGQSATIAPLPFTVPATQ